MTKLHFGSLFGFEIKWPFSEVIYGSQDNLKDELLKAINGKNLKLLYVDIKFYIKFLELVSIYYADSHLFSLNELYSIWVRQLHS